jgi:hypothetical protein
LSAVHALVFGQINGQDGAGGVPWLAWIPSAHEDGTVRVIPTKRRSSVRQFSEGLEITIPARRNIFITLFLGAWLVGWCCGEVSAACALLAGDEIAPMLFLSAWLIMWTIGGGCALYAWLWMVTGKEMVWLGSDALAIKRDVVGFGRLREYELTHIVNLRTSVAVWNQVNWTTPMQFGGGVIAFDYGADTVRFGASIDEAEAFQLVRELKAMHRFPEQAA